MAVESASELLLVRSDRKINKDNQKGIQQPIELSNTQWFNDEKLETLITQADAIGNSRPLTQAGTDARDLTPICPSDMMMGGNGCADSLGEFGKNYAYGIEEMEACSVSMPQMLGSVHKILFAITTSKTKMAKNIKR